MTGIVTASLFPPPAPRRQEERALHEAVMQYLKRALPPHSKAHHSPGEGKRSLRAQRDLKRSGYNAGWPDIEIIWRDHPNIFIELKSRAGYLSPEQRAMRLELEDCGCTVVICKTLGCVENSLIELGMPLRARVSA
jgi:hypothetical protein